MSTTPELKNAFPILDKFIYDGKVGVDHGTHLFNIQDVANTYFADPNDTSVYENFGPLRLPFETVWMEFDNTANHERHTERYGDDFGSSSPIKAAVQLKEYELTPNEIVESIREVQAQGAPMIGESGLPLSLTRRIITGKVYIIPPSTNLLSRKLQNAYHFIESKLFVDDEGRAIAKFYFFGKNIPQIAHVEFSEMVGAWLHAAYMAVGIANCKNITTSTESTRPTSSKKDKRRRRPSTEYHVINLPRAKHSSHGTGDAEGTVRLHTVRGHFKTYTKEKPLMGSIVGTYWWANHARGNADNGEIISTYNVATA